ncbi:MAG: magnesium/cobalt transporter CorA [Pseudomonadota bacterium]
MPPGSLIHIGKRVAEGVRISIVRFDQGRVQVTDDAGLQELTQPLDGTSSTWITVEGLHEVETVEAICHHFRLHPLITEDILNTTQRPKIEDLGDYVFVVLRTLNQEIDPPGLSSEQVSMVLGPRYLLTFLEGGRNHFSEVMNRIKAGKGRIMAGGSDYLAYCIVDTIVDKYFHVLEELAEKIEIVEEDVIENPTTDTIQAIHRLKTDMIFLRRSIWPAREVVSRLLSGQSSLVQEATMPYLRDVYDHSIRVIDIMETYREVVSGLLDIYLSSVSNRLNQIMKVLTIIATIFIPLTFLTGWYGMNFKAMPELESPWGYPMVIFVAVTAVVGMLMSFRRKGWM